MIIRLSSIINHNHNRMSSITRVHTTTWDHFSSCLSYRYFRSSKEVKEVIMRDINDTVLEFWSASRGGTVDPSFFAIGCLLTAVCTIDRSR